MTHRKSLFDKRASNGFESHPAATERDEVDHGDLGTRKEANTGCRVAFHANAALDVEDGSARRISRVGAAARLT